MIGRIPWELKYLLTPWRWLGEWGLVHFYTATDEEDREWLIHMGLAGTLVNCLGATLRSPCGERRVILRIGAFQWKWVRRPGHKWFSFGGFMNWRQVK